MLNPCLFPSEHSFLLVVGIDEKRATPISKPAEPEKTESFLDMPMDTASTDFTNARNSAVEFGHMKCKVHSFSR